MTADQYSGSEPLNKQQSRELIPVTVRTSSVPEGTYRLSHALCCTL